MLFSCYYFYSSGNPTGVPLDERDFGVTEALKHAQFAIDEVLLQLLRATSSPSLDADGGSSSSSGSASSSAQVNMITLNICFSPQYFLLLYYTL